MRLVLVLLVLVPLLTVAFLTVSQAASRWSYRERAEGVAASASVLKQIAEASALAKQANATMYAVEFGGTFGLNISQLSKVMGTDLHQELLAEAASISANPVLKSTARLRSDEKYFFYVMSQIQRGQVVTPAVFIPALNLADDTDRVWFSDVARLQHQADVWQMPSSFDARVAALHGTFVAFNAVENEVGAASYVYLGFGDVPYPSYGSDPPLPATQALIVGFGEQNEAIASFSGHLGPEGQVAWKVLQNDPLATHAQIDRQQAIELALKGGDTAIAPSPAQMKADQVDSAALAHGYSDLVDAAADDVRETGLTQASDATRTFTSDLALLLVLLLICLVAVVAASNLLTRPLKRLAASAARIQDGDFGLEPLETSGPRELVSTIATFNNMTSVLRGVEAKTVALSTEDLSHPDLRAPLPGRTGEALQAAVDRLTARIREREMQRQSLQETATHDQLTGMLSRHAVFDFLSTDVRRRRERGETVAVLFADLDGLKSLNDAYGHEAGDGAIQAVANTLGRATDACDAVGRIGGDEFLVVLCSEHSRASTTAVERIRSQMSSCTVTAGDVIIPLACSVGLALAECDANTDPMELVRQADAAMYEAKKTARATGDSTARLHVAGGASVT